MQSHDHLDILIELTRALQNHLPLEVVLRRVVQTAAGLVDTANASIRLLSTDRTHLLAICRAGSPFHQDPNESFRIGEGLMGWIVEHAQALRVADAEQDPRFAHKPNKMRRIVSYLGVPLISGNTCLGVVSAVNPDLDYFTPRHEALLSLLAGISAPHIEVARLQRLAGVDPLTGTLTLSGLEPAFPEVMVRKGPLSVVLVDVDGFTAVNDRYGQSYGDLVLKHVAAVLADAVRAGDAVVRHKDDEFLLVLADVNLEAAARIAERVRDNVAASMARHGEIAVRLTVSAGVAELRDKESRTRLIRRANQALEEARSDGNRIVLAPR